MQGGLETLPWLVIVFGALIVFVLLTRLLDG